MCQGAVLAAAPVLGQAQTAERLPCMHACATHHVIALLACVMLQGMWCARHAA